MKILPLICLAILLTSCDSSNRDSWNRGVALLEQQNVSAELIPNDAPGIYYGTYQESRKDAAEMLQRLRVQQAGAKMLIKHGFKAKDIPYLTGSQLSDAYGRARTMTVQLWRTWCTISAVDS